MPRTSPFEFARAPPELPGLMGASVWIRLVRAMPSAPVTPFDGAAKAGHDTQSHRVLVAERATDGDGVFPHLRGSGHELGDGQLAVRLDFDDCQVGERIAADDGGRRRVSPVAKRDLDGGHRVSAGLVGDNVVVGDDHAVRAVDDAGAFPRVLPLLAEPAGARRPADLDVDYARAEHRGNRLRRAGLARATPEAVVVELDAAACVAAVPVAAAEVAAPVVSVLPSVPPQALTSTPIMKTMTIATVRSASRRVRFDDEPVELGDLNIPISILPEKRLGHCGDG